MITAQDQQSRAMESAIADSVEFSVWMRDNAAKYKDARNLAFAAWRDARALPAGMEPVAFVSESALAALQDPRYKLAQHQVTLRQTSCSAQTIGLFSAAQVQAMLAQGIAPGWQAVPVEPTVEMLASAIEQCGLSGARLYRVMLAAAPRPPAAHDLRTYAPIAPVSIIWHASPEAVDAAHWAPICEAEGITLAELRQGVSIGVDERGVETEFSQADVLQSMRDMGFWGFVDTNTRTIHAWADPATPDNAIMEFLGHEIGHVTGTPDERDWEEEARADQYGDLVKMAHSMLLTRAPATPVTTGPADATTGPRPVTTGAAQERKPLTDEQIDAVLVSCAKYGASLDKGKKGQWFKRNEVVAACHAIEVAHSIKEAA